METAAKQPDGDVPIRTTLSMEDSIVQSSFGFFDIRSLLGVLNINDTTINLVLDGGNMKLEYPDTNARDAAAAWFLTAKKAHVKACREYDDARLRMQASAVEIQNKMAGAMVK